MIKKISEYPKKKSDSDETRKKAKILVVMEEHLIKKKINEILTGSIDENFYLYEVTYGKRENVY